jgi:hypothetical protein
MSQTQNITAAVANTLKLLRWRRRGYKLWFGTDAGKEVLKDLLAFSKFLEGPARPTNEETWRLIGRQDMIRRIQQHVHLTEEQLFALYNGMTVPFLNAVEQKEREYDNA